MQNEENGVGKCVIFKGDTGLESPANPQTGKSALHLSQQLLEGEEELFGGEGFGQDQIAAGG
jgi:hypothetical protein